MPESFNHILHLRFADSAPRPSVLPYRTKTVAVFAEFAIQCCKLVVPDWTESPSRGGGVQIGSKCMVGIFEGSADESGGMGNACIAPRAAENSKKFLSRLYFCRHVVTEVRGPARNAST